MKYINTFMYGACHSDRPDGNIHPHPLRQLRRSRQGGDLGLQGPPGGIKTTQTTTRISDSSGVFEVGRQSARILT